MAMAKWPCVVPPCRALCCMDVEKPMHALVSSTWGWGRNPPVSGAFSHPFQEKQSVVTLKHGILFQRGMCQLQVLCPHYPVVRDASSGDKSELCPAGVCCCH